MFDKCYLCSTDQKITADHIPPRNLFPEPRPSNLITVPCCESCNQSYNLDDEALRCFLAAFQGQSAPGKWIWKNKVMDSTFKRSPLLKRAVAKSLRKLTVEGPSGANTVSAITIPKDRVNRYLIRITKGLLYRFYPHINYFQQEFSVEQFLLNENVMSQLFENFVYDERGEGVFRFYRAIAEDGNEGVWVYIFYDQACFLVQHS